MGKDASGDTSYISAELLASTTNAVATAPTAPVAAQVTAASVLLTWTDADPLAVSYNLFRDGTQIASSLSSTSYLDTTVTPNTDPSYSVQAINPNGVSSSMSPATSVLVPDSSTLPAGYRTTAPAPPTGLQAVAGNADSGNTDNAITLTWAASSTPNVTYEIDRNGVNLGGTAATTFADTGLDPDTTYSYAVIAYDGSFTKSTPASASGATAADHTLPTAPFSIWIAAQTSSSVTLAWGPSFDNAGISHYNVYLRVDVAGQYQWQLIGSSTGTSFTDNSSTDSWDGATFKVTAVDLSGNESGQPYVVESVGYNPFTDYGWDTSLYQYIPSDWQQYFYTQLVPGYAQAFAALSTPYHNPEGLPYGVTQWLDSTDLVIANGQILNKPFVYNPQLTTGELYIDADNNGTYDASDWDVGLQPMQIVHGSTGMFYLDLPEAGGFEAGDPIWKDPSGKDSFDPDIDTIVYNPNHVVISPGAVGRNNDLYYYDFSSTREVVWVDNSQYIESFQGDFAEMYDALDQLMEWHGGTDAMAADLIAAGVPVTGAGGTISVNNTGEASLSDVTFPFTISSGDLFQVSGHWYTAETTEDQSIVLLSSSDTFQLYGGAPQAISQPLQSVNWTLVPSIAASGDMPSLSLVQGQPGIGYPGNFNLVFPQQFEEIRDVLLTLGATNISAPPTTPLPLTTETDYLNRVPDTNLDGIVQVPTNLDSIDADTGTITAQSGRDLPQVYLPIFTDVSGALPIHGYIVQGGFGATTTSLSAMGEDVETLPPNWRYSQLPVSGNNDGPDGEPFAFSLDTHLRIDLLLNEADNHILRVEVIRPDGNSVVFDFPGIKPLSNIQISERQLGLTPECSMSFGRSQPQAMHILNDMILNFRLGWYRLLILVLACLWQSAMRKV